MASRGRPTRSVGRHSDEEWALIVTAAKLRKAANPSKWAWSVLHREATKIIAHNRMIRRKG